MQLSSEQLKSLKFTFENIESQIIDTELDADTAINTLIAREAATSNKKTISNIKKILKNKKLFEIEIGRSTNNNLIKEARLAGLNQYESTIACKKEYSGKSCGSFTRYISNRGCVKCQTSAKLSKQEKSTLTQLIINDVNSPKKSQKVARLIKELGLKKSAAYRLIKLHEDSLDFYKIPKTKDMGETEEGESINDFEIERDNDYHPEYY